MLTSADVEARLKEIPFKPFRIVTSSGANYDIFHPDMAMITKRFVVVGWIDPIDPLIPDQVAHVSMLHISELRTISQKATV